MMGIFARWIAAGLYGLAMGRFISGRYGDAARLFEKACRLAPDEERMDLCHAYLGRSYLALGQHDKALESLSRAYEPYRMESEKTEGEFEQQEFIKFLRALGQALRAKGQAVRAQEVEHEAEEYVLARKKLKETR